MLSDFFWEEMEDIDLEYVRFQQGMKFLGKLISHYKAENRCNFWYLSVATVIILLLQITPNIFNALPIPKCGVSYKTKLSKDLTIIEELIFITEITNTTYVQKK